MNRQERTQTLEKDKTMQSVRGDMGHPVSLSGRTTLLVGWESANIRVGQRLSCPVCALFCYCVFPVSFCSVGCHGCVSVIFDFHLGFLSFLIVSAPPRVIYGLQSEARFLDFDTFARGSKH